MEYRSLGNSGLKVSEIGLGTNNFGFRVDEAASIAITHHALDSGINIIDTADWYSRQGLSETYIGKAIKGRRSQVIIATKFGFPMGSDPNDIGASRYHILQALEGSLKRLDTDYIDLYQLHRPDPTTPIDETLRALDCMVKAGKVRYIGVCNMAAWQVADAIWTSRVNSLESFITCQVEYNLFDRAIENELVPLCKKFGLGVIPWGPLAGGFLSDKHQRGAAAPPGSRLAIMGIYGKLWSEANFDKLEKLRAFAKERGHSTAELAIAWLLYHPWIPTVIAGATKPEHVTGNIKAGAWKLTQQEAEVVGNIVGGVDSPKTWGDGRTS